MADPRDVLADAEHVLADADALMGDMVCPTCHQPKHPKSKTCRACAIEAGVYQRACRAAGRAAARVRLRALMVARGWTEEHARIYLAGWKAGRHAAKSDRARRKHSVTT